MNAAIELEKKVFALQEPMNAVIDRGSSAVQQFYSGAAVFVTGGSGFLGKQLIEKLFRSCAVKIVYLLIRPKKGKPIKERMEFMLNDPVFDLVREKQPRFADRIVPVEGDVADIRLGLSDKNWDKIAKEVDIIFHVAATVRFDAPIRTATLINVRGTREIVALAKDCNKLKLFLHVSTAYTHATVTRAGTELNEEFYPCPVPPDVMIGLVETVEENRLNDMTPQLIKDWPNTYTFTKAIAEELVRVNAAGLPVCIFRPPIVMAAYIEPAPGWADMSVIFGHSGILTGIGLGVLRVFYVRTDLQLNIVPLDFVNNAMIAAGWDSAARRDAGEEIPIYTISSTKREVVWSFLGKTIRSDSTRRLATPKAVWYCYLIETDKKILYFILTWLLHYIPAYVIDGICYVFGIKLENIPSVKKIYEKIYKLSSVFGHFSTKDWYFNDDNLTSMISRMSIEDKIIYNCDVLSIDYSEYIQVILVGLRKYILKDGLKDTAKAYKKQRIFKYLNILFIILYVYVLFMIMFYFYKTVKYILY